MRAKTMKAAVWFALYRRYDTFDPTGPFRFKKPVGARKARAEIKKQMGVRTLHGWDVWPVR